MIYDIIILSEHLVGETVLYQYREFILLLFFISKVVYKRYIKHKWKIYDFSCDCNPNDILNDLMITNRSNKPTPCGAGEDCICHALYHLVKAIDEASESIFIAMPALNTPQLLECISSANSRLIKIQIILNHSEGLENCPGVKKLLDEDIDIRTADRPMNGAICLIDPVSFNDGVLIQSPPWTQSALYRTSGQMRFDRHEPLESEYEKILSNMWKRSRALPTNKSFFKTFISKLKRRILLWRKETIDSLRDIYSKLRIVRRFIRLF